MSDNGSIDDTIGLGATMPLPYAMKHTSLPMFKRRGSTNDDGDVESFIGVSRTRTGVPPRDCGSHCILSLR